MADVAACRNELEAALGPGALLSDPLALRLYSRDASMVEGGCALVALPETVDEVRACVRAAVRHGLPIVPRGSGTGLAGGATPIGDALVIATSKLNRILELRPADRLAWVEPGLFNLELSRALAPTGFTYAPDPSSQQVSTIGGNVNTNAGGPHCLAYGVTSAHVLALDVVMPDGSLERIGSEAPEAPGYDLRGVVVGSEGTLGIVVAACVRLVPVPPAVRTMLLDFTTVEACAATVTEIIGRGVVPAAMEMMDRGIVIAAERFAHAGYPTDAAAILLVEVDGVRAGVEAQSAEVEAAGREHGVRTIRVAADEAERALLWKGRKSAFGAVAQIAPNYHLHDCVVPRTKLVEVLTGVYEICGRENLIVTNVFHAGDGNLHPLISFDRSVPGMLERVLARQRAHRPPVHRRRRRALGRARDRSGEARFHAARLHTGRSGDARLRAGGVRPPSPDEPAEGPAVRGSLWRRDGGAGGDRCRRGRGRDDPGGDMDLIHPNTAADVVTTLVAAGADRRRVLVVGGRTHMDRGNPTEADVELWTTMLDGIVAYDPAEMLVVVAAGTRVGDLQTALSAGNQEWAVDAPEAATVGGVIAAGASSPRRLRVGHVRDTVVELELVTGDGRLVKSGARTVKNVTGYDLHRLATGSLGTLGVLVQAALKVRPLPAARRRLIAYGDGLELGERLLSAVPLPAAVIAGPDHVEVVLDGWPAELEEQTAAARSVAEVDVEDETEPHALTPPIDAVEGSTVVEISVPPSRLPDVLSGHRSWRALFGVGLAWVGLEDSDGALTVVRRRAEAAGGIAPVVRGPGGLGDTTLPAMEVQRRIKQAFDPGGVLVPGRAWGGL